MSFLKLIYALCLVLNLSLFSDQVEKVFSKIYRNKLWGVNEFNEGGSGSGSTRNGAKEYIDCINEFIAQNNITSILDIGCGDGVVLGMLDLNENMTYTGLDVVKSVILKNKEKYPKYNFYHSNAILDDIPIADLILCKDVLQHLTNEQVKKITNKIKKNCKYAIITNDVEHTLVKMKNFTNIDIAVGEGRFLRLQDSPFNLQGEDLLEYTCPTGEVKTMFLLKGDIQ